MSDVQIRVSAARATGALPHFWQSTGFTPASLLLGEPMQQLCQYLGSIPHGGVTHVRIHYLLELVRGSRFDTQRPDYDWSLLDRGLDVLVESRLKPFFELMGNPGGYFDNFEADVQVRAWRRLVRDLALRCMDRYGQDEVRSWYFETWNEPDVGWWTQSDRAFHNYYDACSAGLADADRRLLMGGPGTCRTLSDRFKSFIAHCDRGRDYFTGRKGVRLDYISIHEKGQHSHKEDLDPDMQGVCRREGRIMEWVRRYHPRLGTLPFMNNECDPPVGWLELHTWHGKAYYAAIVAKAIGQHLGCLVDEKQIHYALLSNDNGFLGTWGQRTHLALFGTGEQQALGRFEQIKKPAHNVMTMLALLGDQRLAVTPGGGAFDDLGVIATKRGKDQVAVLIFNVADRIMSSGKCDVRLQIDGLGDGPWTLVHYAIRDGVGDPYAVWHTSAVSPERVSGSHAELSARMRQEQELRAIEGPTGADVQAGTLACRIALPLPSVSLLVLSRKPAGGPKVVTGLKARRYHGLTGQAQVMLTWRPAESRVIHTYEVLHAPSRRGPWKRINQPDLLCGAYLHVAEDVRGFYAIRAVDLWGRQGRASRAIEV